MRLLLDTQILLRVIYQPGRIPAEVAAMLVDPANSIQFSAVSIAEIAIKASLGRADFPFQPQEVSEAAQATGFGELSLTARHARHLGTMPWHHRDPFDRLLIAQSVEDGLRFLTTDKTLGAYSDLVSVVS